MKKLNAKFKDERITNQLDEEINYNFDVQNGFVELDILSLDEKSVKPRVIKSLLNETEPGTPRSRISHTNKNTAENSSHFKSKKVSISEAKSRL
jgi:hypothetical protein